MAHSSPSRRSALIKPGLSYSLFFLRSILLFFIRRVLALLSLLILISIGAVTYAQRIRNAFEKKISASSRYYYIIFKGISENMTLNERSSCLKKTSHIFPILKVYAHQVFFPILPIFSISPYIAEYFFLCQYIRNSEAVKCCSLFPSSASNLS